LIRDGDGSVTFAGTCATAAGEQRTEPPELPDRRHGLRNVVHVGARGEGGVERSLGDPHAVERSDEVDPPVLAPVLTVGHDRQAGAFLQRDRRRDRAIFFGVQRCDVDLAADEPLARREQLLGPQQASDVIRPEEEFPHAQVLLRNRKTLIFA
jgi:hypothetical protein